MGRKAPDLGWLNGVVRDSKPRNVHAPLCELEFVWVERDPCLSDPHYEINSSPPVTFQISLVMDSAVDTALFALAFC